MQTTLQQNFTTNTQQSQSVIDLEQLKQWYFSKIRNSLFVKMREEVANTFSCEKKALFFERLEFFSNWHKQNRNTDYFFVSVKKLASITFNCERTIKSMLSWFHKNGILDKYRDAGYNKRIYYRINYDGLFKYALESGYFAKFNIEDMRVDKTKQTKTPILEKVEHPKDGNYEGFFDDCEQTECDFFGYDEPSFEALQQELAKSELPKQEKPQQAFENKSVDEYINDSKKAFNAIGKENFDKLENTDIVYGIDGDITEAVDPSKPYCKSVAEVKELRQKMRNAVDNIPQPQQKQESVQKKQRIEMVDLPSDYMPRMELPPRMDRDSYVSMSMDDIKKELSQLYDVYPYPENKNLTILKCLKNYKLARESGAEFDLIRSKLVEFKTLQEIMADTRIGKQTMFFTHFSTFINKEMWKEDILEMPESSFVQDDDLDGMKQQILKVSRAWKRIDQEDWYEIYAGEKKNRPDYFKKVIIDMAKERNYYRGDTKMDLLRYEYEYVKIMYDCTIKQKQEDNYGNLAFSRADENFDYLDK